MHEHLPLGRTFLHILRPQALRLHLQVEVLFLRLDVPAEKNSFTLALNLEIVLMVTNRAGSMSADCDGAKIKPS